MAAEHRTAAWKWWQDYGDGITQPDDPRLVSVPSVRGRDCKMHWAAAAEFRALSADWQAEFPRSPGLLVCSGWRTCAEWQATRADYEAELLRRYRVRLPNASDAEVLEYGRLRLAYRSSHFTGLTFDLGSPPPMRPDTHAWAIAEMRRSSVYDWLMRKAAARGFRNYLVEPHHWEMPLPASVWRATGPEAD